MIGQRTRWIFTANFDVCDWRRKQTVCLEFRLILNSECNNILKEQSAPSKLATYKDGEHWDIETQVDKVVLTHYTLLADQGFGMVIPNKSLLLFNISSGNLYQE